MNVLLTEASEGTAATGGGMPLFGIIIMYAVLFGALWFFFWRPQKKERKRVAAMLAELEIGDCVLTTGGFIGIVIDITDDTVIVEFGNNKNCRIPMEKSAITRVEKPTET